MNKNKLNSNQEIRYVTICMLANKWALASIMKAELQSEVLSNQIHTPCGKLHHRVQPENYWCLPPAHWRALPRERGSCPGGCTLQALDEDLPRMEECLCVCVCVCVPRLTVFMYNVPLLKEFYNHYQPGVDYYVHVTTYSSLSAAIRGW